MKDKLLSMLGICRKAGKLTHGFDASAEAVTKKQAKLVVTASDLSPKTKKEIEFIANKTGIAVTGAPATIKEIEQKTGKRAGVLAITDEGLAKAVVDAIKHADMED